MRTAAVAVALVLVLALSTSSPAEGIRVDPGLWEFASSMPDPLGGEPHKQVHRTCVRDSVITPNRVMAHIDDCRIHNAAFRGQTAKWKMTCQTPVGPMRGSGSLRATSSAVSGSVEMTIAIGSFAIPTTGTFKGRRLGACR